MKCFFMKKIKILITLLIITIAMTSCSKDDEINFTSQIIGEWQRSDYKDDFEYKLIFNSNETGFKIVRVGTMETAIISSIVNFNWNIDSNSITIIENEDVIKSPISFNGEGQLILNNYSDFPFNRVE